MAYYILRIKEGKVVTIRKYKKHLCLCVADTQHPVASVQIEDRAEGNKILVAFSFLYKKKQLYIKVENKTLKLVEVNGSSLSDEHWFEKKYIGGGEHYCLKSVVNSHYVSMSRERELVLSPTDKEYIQVTHER